MLSPRWRKVLRDLWLHKSRTLLVIAAIAVGLIGAGSVLDSWSLVRQVTRDEYRASNPASATLRVEAADAAMLTRLRAMPSIAAAQARRTVAGSARTTSGWRTAVFYAIDDFTAGRIGKVKPESGRWPPPDEALVIEHSSLEFSGLAPGDSVELRIGEGAPRFLPIVGVARDVALAPGWMEHVVYAFTTPSTLAALGAPSTFNEVLIRVRDDRLDRSGVRAVASDARRTIESAGGRITNIDVPVPGRHVHAGQMDSLLYTQGAFGLLALALSCLLVINLISAMLTGQVREIGVMKAIGARRSQVAGMYLGLALILGILAALIAVPLAALIGRAYADFTANLLNFSTEGFSIPPSAIALQIAVGLLLPLAAASIPVIRGCGISVSEALRDVGIAPRLTSTSSGIPSRLSGLSRPLLLSLRNAFRRRERMALTLITLAMGGAVYLGALNLRAAVRGSVDLLFGSQRFDMVVRVARPLSPDSLERAIAAIGGVAAVEAWSGGRAMVAYPDGTMGSAFPLTALPIGSPMVVPRIESGRWLQPGDERVLVVNRGMLEHEPSLSLGGETTLLIAGRAMRWRVIGVVEAGPSPTAYAPRASHAALVSDGQVDRAVVRSALRGVPAQRELALRLRGELERAGLPVQSTQLLAENRRVTEDHLLMVAAFLGVMGQVMILVGGLGLASTMSLAVLERTREIGVLRAIGARHRAILTMIQVEGLVIALLSWAIAIPLSLPMSVLLGKAFGRIMLPIPLVLVPEMTGVLRWLAVVVLVSLVACLWPAWRAMRVPTRVALAYE